MDTGVFGGTTIRALCSLSHGGTGGTLCARHPLPPILFIYRTHSFVYIPLERMCRYSYFTVWCETWKRRTNETTAPKKWEKNTGTIQTRVLHVHANRWLGKSIFKYFLCTRKTLPYLSRSFIHGGRTVLDAETCESVDGCQSEWQAPLDSRVSLVNAQVIKLHRFQHQHHLRRRWRRGTRANARENDVPSNKLVYGVIKIIMLN